MLLLAGLGVGAYFLVNKAEDMVQGNIDAIARDFQNRINQLTSTVTDPLSNITFPSVTWPTTYYNTNYNVNVPSWVTTPEWLNGMTGIPDPTWLSRVRVWTAANPGVTLPKLWW